MKRFMVTLHYTVAPPSSAPPAVDVLAGVWPQGHRFSVWNGASLTVGAETRALSERLAIEQVDETVHALWPVVAAGALTLIQSIPEPLYVGVGARVGGAVRSARQARAPWRSGTGARPGWVGGVDPDGLFGDDDEGDEGGDGAGVREPRRPDIPPGHLAVALEPPAR